MLVACGLGLPLPEDIVLITGGWLAAMPHGVPSVSAMVLVGLAGILVGDSIIFKAGHDYGERLLETRLGKHIPAERVQRVRDLFDKHGPKFIMIARFVPGVRAVTYFVAGTSGVPFWKFVIYDGLAACASAPAWVIAGYWCGKHHMIGRADAWAKHFQLTLLAVLFLIAVTGSIVCLLRQRQTERRKLASAAGQSGGSAGLSGPLDEHARRASLP